ncbi:Anti-repressor SinI [Schinkia azotoformans MEV2011]|uniref:Anti-repressor SinI n=1 Tax=Schinkia azotoformans MEV2011 TaxID=1348973 RepID=A0A072NKF7_SCHAZ|nr:anti-repressor SinI family protein [Schinkia azotoformans]KEF37752.1 Anti-repressor SinI [Schinkia azotoformans MEV2011]MEC1695629.1 anti-repressor SinI family protein [Schinkia azotoformans]MEC1717200.1 anti-repressor SinI family protein [Schinkia azotoformans]MEC1726552.1 anti-repressor SinI family protein [Schinkia azotoformans]MEC1742014.1 anti-repressor SinI family protein [Schinkia azotoformans]
MDTQSTQSSQTQDIKLPTVDLEWLQLLLVAKSMGLSIEDIRVFLRNNSDNVEI